MTSGGAAAFSPLDIPGIQLWLDASQIVGLNDGDSVATWSDLSGNANNATQATASKKPLYKVNRITAKAAVLFDGVDDVLDIPTITVGSNATLFVVFNFTAAVGLRPFGGAAGNYWFYGNQYVVGTDRYHSQAMGFTGNVLATYRNNANTMTVRNNGTNVSLNAPVFSGPYTGASDGVGAAGLSYHSGDIAMVLCYNTPLTDQQITQVEDYIRGIYPVF